VIENEEARKRKKKATSKEYRFFVWFGLVWLGVNRRVVMVDMI